MPSPLSHRLARGRARLLAVVALVITVGAASGAVWITHVVAVNHAAERQAAREVRLAGLATAANVCQILYKHDPNYDPVASLRDLNRQIPPSAVVFIERRCPAKYSLMMISIHDIPAASGPAGASAPTWENQDCAERYQEAASSLFTRAEQESMREAVDADCANLSPSR